MPPLCREVRPAGLFKDRIIGQSETGIAQQPDQRPAGRTRTAPPHGQDDAGQRRQQHERIKAGYGIAAPALPRKRGKQLDAPGRDGIQPKVQAQQPAAEQPDAGPRGRRRARLPEQPEQGQAAERQKRDQRQTVQEAAVQDEEGLRPGQQGERVQIRHKRDQDDRRQRPAVQTRWKKRAFPAKRQAVRLVRRAIQTEQALEDGTGQRQQGGDARRGMGQRLHGPASGPSSAAGAQAAQQDGKRIAVRLSAGPATSPAPAPAGADAAAASRNPGRCPADRGVRAQGAARHRARSPAPQRAGRANRPPPPAGA